MQKANSLLVEIAKKNKYISEITEDDYPLFQSFFDKEPHSYGNGWTYVTQGVYGTGSNNLGYKYYDGKNLSVVCVYPKVEDKETRILYWIRPMGENIIDIIEDISKDAQDSFGLPTFVKKLFKNQYDEFIRRGFKDTSVFPWHSISPSEDDTFPEQIFDCQETYKLAQTLPRRKHLRKSYARVLQINENYDVEISDRNFEDNAWELTSKFFDSEIIQGKKVNLSNKFDYYNMIFNNPKRESLERKIVYVDSVPLGYYVSEALGDYTSLYALIILRNKLKFLVDYTLLDIFKNCKTKYLDMGGSEDEGIHLFKQKYMPIKENQMYWVTKF